MYSKDFQMWVGKTYYPTPKHFIDEAFDMGVCKRLPGFVDGLTPNSKVFLSYWEKASGGTVMGFFYPQSVEVIIDDDDKAAKVELIRKFTGIEGRAVKKSVMVKEKRRGCGFRKVGGVYLRTFIDDPSVKEVVKGYFENWLGISQTMADVLEVKGNFFVFKNSPKTASPHFRGIREVDPGISDHWITAACGGKFAGQIRKVNKITVQGTTWQKAAAI